ncbi:MAG TPA: glycosyltransferase family 1 protein, partial [Baekduia sp.]|nr:glycosyltransferase family 1 protein [Baekduia sp.]
FVAADASADLLALCREAGLRVTRVPGATAGARLRPAAEYGLLPLAALARRVDVLHSLGNAGPVRVPRMACVISVHDVIWRRAGDDWGDAAAQRAMDRVVAPTARRADLVISGSEDSARDVVDELGVARERVVAVLDGARPPSPDAAFVGAADLRARHDLPPEGPLLLCVAQKRPYKNQEAVIRALAALDDPAAALVLPGAATPYEARLRDLAQELGVADRVRLPGWVDDEELEGLYRAATALVLPSRIEGFGLPVLEAMLRGTPVVCSSTTALGEVAGDSALLVDPDDQETIDAAVARVVADAGLRERLIAAGHARAAPFTWKRTADETVAAYRSALASRA